MSFSERPRSSSGLPAGAEVDCVKGTSWVGEIWLADTFRYEFLSMPTDGCQRLRNIRPLITGSIPFGR